jgi:hypothetical protein
VKRDGPVASGGGEAELVEPSAGFEGIGSLPVTNGERVMSYLPVSPV